MSAGHVDPGAEESAQAEAAAWLARLHSDERSEADVAGFRRWLDASDLHRRAFDAATASWELAGGLTDIRREPIARYSRRAVLAGAGAAAVLAAGGSALLLRREAEETVRYASDVGEIRKVRLADGSRLVLDTSSEVEVVLGGRRRAVTLLAGRAHVEVAKDPDRPFSVTVADREVIARGTVFDVERHGDGMRVMLTEGLVDVVSTRSGERNSLVPGQRLISSAGVVRIDQPDPERLAAWRSGRLIFDDDTLEAAVAEMNRYDRRKILVPDPAVRMLRISGSYATGDSRLFAQSVSQLLGVRAEQTGESIVLHAGDGRPGAPG